MTSIPAKWVILAGELLAEVQGMDHDEHLSCPADWHHQDYLDFKESVHDYLNEAIDEEGGHRYESNSPLLNWQAMIFLGALLQEIEIVHDDAFSTQVLVVNPC